MRSNEEIIDKMIELRKEKKLTITEIAHRVGYAKSGISLYFRKLRPFPLNKLEIFAEALGTTPEFLLGYDEPSETNTPWKPVLTEKDERNIEQQLEAILNGTSEKGNFLSYGGKDPSDMNEEEYEDHILFKNALRETLRIAKKINKETHTPHQHRKGT